MDREIGRFGQPIPADDPPIGTSAPRADSSFNGAFDAVERAERAILADLGLNGILQGGTAVQHTVGGNPSWSVEIAGPFAARDTAGKRITFADLLRTPSMQHDDNAVATAVTTSGKKRAVTLYAKAARANSCQHPDDNTPPNEIYALQTEDIGWSVVVGAEVLEASDLDLPPGGVAGKVLILDATLHYGDTGIATSAISQARAEKAIYILNPDDGSRINLGGTLADALLALAEEMGGGGGHGGDTEHCAGGTTPDFDMSGNTSLTRVPLVSESDSNSMFDGTYPGRINLHNGAAYRVQAGLKIFGQAPSSFWFVSVYRNGSEFLYDYKMPSCLDGTGAISICFTENFNANDYLELMVQQSDGVTESGLHVHANMSVTQHQDQ